ncbi:hypothetical protein [Streptomyces sp. NPDC005507]|uniref:hypothetical protein n=1 Tax=Streptomyces sp. NPDC005507 TaxID=3154885 RepID=UPI0033AB9A23
MTQTTGKYADFERLREQAIALRRNGRSLRQIADELGVRSKETLSRLVRGEPPAERSKRPNAKDDLRAQARELRRPGRTYNEIQAELGCSKSSVSLWVRDMPKPEATCTPEEQRPRMNHESADVAAAEAHWAEVVGVDASAFSKPTIKKHNPRTVRKNYHGCLVIYVRQSAELYRRTEGTWYGIVLGARPTA